MSYKAQYPPWKVWLRNEAKIKATWREVSQILELEKAKTTKVPGKQSKPSITKVLETAKQGLTAPGYVPKELH